MTTNFFKNIAEMQVQGDWVICIKQSIDKMTVSVLFKNDSCGDAARKIVPPLVFSNKTAAEIDEKCFADLNEAIPDTAKMFSSMEHYLKQKEEAKKQSQMEKDKAEKEKKAKEEKKKKYDEAMKKVAELEKEDKFREAWMKVPQPCDFPDYAEDLRKRKKELTAKFAPDLFGTPIQVEEAKKPQETNITFDEEPQNEEVPEEIQEHWEDDYEEQ